MTTIGVLLKENKKQSETIPQLIKIAKKIKVEIKFFYPEEINFLKNPNQQSFGKIDILYPRIYAEKNLEEFLHSISSVQYYINHKIPIINSIKGFLIGTDKMRQYLIAQSIGINTPKSTIVTSTHKIDEVLKYFSYPIILKKQYGYGGAGVYIAKSKTEAHSTIKKFSVLKQPLIIQEFIKTKNYSDIRIGIVGNKTSYGLIRFARPGDFRANLAQGAKFEYFTPDKKISALALKLAKTVDLEICAIDFLKSGDTYYLTEINRSPGIFPWVEPEIKFGQQILEYCVSKAKA